MKYKKINMFFLRNSIDRIFSLLYYQATLKDRKSKQADDLLKQIDFLMGDSEQSEAIERLHGRKANSDPFRDENAKFPKISSTHLHKAERFKISGH